jgi:hypothetical protein
MFVWSKLSAAKWLDAWEDRFRGNPNFVMHVLKGGKSIRLEVFCAAKKDADAIADQFGGSVRKLARTDWAAAGPAVPPPIKVRDRFLVTQAAAPKDLARLAKEHPGRDILSLPPEMAFGTALPAGPAPTSAAAPACWRSPPKNSAREKSSPATSIPSRSRSRSGTWSATTSKASKPASSTS